MIGSLAIGLGYMGQPHLVLRFMAISSPDEVRKGALIAVGWALIAFFGAILIGLTGLAHFGPEAMGAGRPDRRPGTADAPDGPHLHARVAGRAHDRAAPSPR